ncbi:hypothetical protein CONPUDRAFT_68654 [Coniophora puteana RWD-64-598 SS2]|uniref:Uncharacterized protein n=1 Tax=Coniophora puteana (strain RWD-64-598) TaxID=741705 RepID=A0A5M3N4Q5_CONPW|nr:uncharacterized protein CONPUDRAFT_68654 [Coniophora puteana RWD-64-598 SS2]EIW86034.1 hypothetical protein CONPUDRAFT_68654 [Coniophora puteana RWD-64-598 SS2]
MASASTRTWVEIAARSHLFNRHANDLIQRLFLTVSITSPRSTRIEACYRGRQPLPPTPPKDPDSQTFRLRVDHTGRDDRRYFAADRPRRTVVLSIKDGLNGPYAGVSGLVQRKLLKGVDSGSALESVRLDTSGGYSVLV